jgi:hypothetical protein
MRSILVRVALWLIFGSVAFLALYIWQASIGAFFVIMAGAIAILFLLLFFFVIIESHRRSYISTQFKFEKVHPGHDIIPEEFWNRVLQTVDDLAPCGFNVRGHFRRGECVPGTVSFVTLLENKKERDVARLAIVFVQSKKASRMHPILGIYTEFVDGTELVTANNRILSHLPMPKNRVALWLPDVHDAAELYHIHQQAARRLGVVKKRWNLDGDPVDYMDSFSNAEIARWVKLGYYKPDATGERLRLTWKGAILMATRMIPPTRNLYVAWRKHQTNKLLRKLEE